MSAMSLMTVNDSNVWDLLGKYLVSRQAFPVDALPFLTVCVPLAYGGSPGVDCVSYRGVHGERLR